MTARHVLRRIAGPRLLPALVCALVMALSGPDAARALDASEMFEDPALEERARALGRQLRCLKCQNQSIFDSNASMARDLRVLVREQIEAGRSDDEIIEHVAARYGDFVLLEPPVGNHTVVLWAAPAGLLIIGAGLVLLYHRGRTSGRAPRADLDPETRAAAQRILEGERP